MSFLSTLWSPKEKEPPAARNITVKEMEEEFDLIRVVEDTPGKEFAIIAPRTSTAFRSQTSDTQEFGTTSPSPFTSWVRQEYNYKLAGIFGLKTWDQMRKSDGTVRGTLRAIKIPALSGRWYMQDYCMDDATEEQKTLWKKQAAWCWRNLTELMSIGWIQVLTETMLMCDFGYYMFELVWSNKIVDGELMTVLTKMAPRHPMDVKQWIFDLHGGPVAVVMFTPVSDQYPLGEVVIPIENLVVFTFDREAGNIEGVSVLRSAYQHYYYKTQLYKIDAIQKERHGIGIPLIKLPMGFKKGVDDVKAEELGRNIRTNERAHVVLPPGWELLMLKLEGQPVDPMESIEHHNEAIRENVLTNFIAQGARQDDLVMFMKAARFVADLVAEDFNLYVVSKMMKYNWPFEEYMPKLKVRRVGETADWRTLSFAIRNLIGAGVIIPDEPLERNLREEMDLTEIDHDTSRLIATPQNPYDINDPNNPTQRDIQDIEDPSGSSSSSDIHNNQNPNYDRANRNLQRRKSRGRKQSGARVGLPRQTPPGQQRNAFGLPRANGGTDRSGN